MSNDVVEKDDFTILIVDDEEDFINETISTLEIEGYNVYGTQDSNEAMKMIKEGNIDILLLDYFMPDITGEQVVKEIRTFDKELVIILQTGYAGEKPPLEMLEKLGIQGYIDKTEGIEKLLLWVTSAVKVCEQKHELKRMFEEVTLAHETIKSIKDNQQKLIEQERLASLGELMVSVSDNLSSKLLSVSSTAYTLDEVVDEYDNSIDDENVTKQDHHEIAKEMKDYTANMKKYCSKMSDVLKAINEQSTRFDSSQKEQEFTLNELIKLTGLMDSELKRYNCTLNTDFQVDMDTKLKGEVKNLAHVITNLIRNAIESYEGNGGQIEFKISKNEENIQFSIKDYGIGISEEVKDKIFNGMVTTKDGAGLGLYISNSIVKGNFGGHMCFDTEPEKGSTFYVLIPISN